MEKNTVQAGPNTCSEVEDMFFNDILRRLADLGLAYTRPGNAGIDHQEYFCAYPDEKKILDKFSG